MKLSRLQKSIIIGVGVLAVLGPNGLYLHTLIFNPELNQSAMSNPTAQAFMIEAMMLLGLFLWYVYDQTKSWFKVVTYLALAFAGSLAFSLPLFLFLEQPRNAN